jgi:hypothetical protein
VRVAGTGDVESGLRWLAGVGGGSWRVALLLVILRTCSKWVAAVVAVGVGPRGDG